MADRELQYVLTVKDDGSVAIHRVAAAFDKASSSGDRFWKAVGRGRDLVVLGNQGLELYKKALEGVHKAYEKLIAPTIEQGEQLLQLSRRFNTSVETLASFQKLAQSSGIELGSLTLSLRTLNVAMAGINKPGSDAKAILNTLGVDAKKFADAVKRDPVAAIRQLTEEFAKFKDTPERFRDLAKLVGGRVAQSLNQLINTPKAAREELEKFAAQFPKRMTTATAEAAEAVKTNFAKVAIATKELYARLVDSALVQAIADRVNRRAQAIADFVKGIPEAQLNRVRDAMVRVIESGGKLADTLVKISLSELAVKLYTLFADAMSNLADSLDRISRMDLSALIQLVASGGAGAALGYKIGGAKGAVIGALVGGAAGLASPQVSDQLPSINAGQAQNRVRDFVNRRFQDPLSRALGREPADIAGALGLSPAYEAPPTRTPGAGTVLRAQTPFDRPFTERDAPISLLRHGGEGEEKKDYARPDNAQAAAALAKQLAQLNAQLAAGVDKVALFNAGINAQVDSLLKGDASLQGYREAFRRAFADQALQKAAIELTEQTRALDNEITLLRDPTQKLAVAIAEVTEKYRAEIETTYGSAKAHAEVERRLAAHVERLRALNAENGKRALEQVNDQITALVNPSAAVAIEFKNMRRELGEFLGTTPGLAQAIDHLEELKRTAGSFVDVFQSIEDSFLNVIKSMAAGTLDMKKRFESLKLGIIGSFADAFAEGLKKKLGFEAALRVNVVQFLSNIGGIINGTASGSTSFVGSLLQGVFQGGGTNGQVTGVLGGVFERLGIPSGVGGGGAGAAATFGGFGGGATPIIQGGQVVGATGGRFGAGISFARPAGGLFSDPVGLGFKGVGAAQAGYSLLGGSSFGAGGALGVSASNAEIAQAALAVDAGRGLGATLGNLGSVVTVVASLYSLYKSVQGTIEANKAFRQGTLGAPESRNFAAASYGGLGVGIGVGAGVGAIFGPIGAIAGAAIGAGIATAIAQQTGSGITSAVAGATGRRGGLGITQGEFEKGIKDDTVMKLLFGGSKFGTGGFASPLAPLPGVKLSILDFFIPSIDLIFRKIFSQFVKDTSGVSVNRQLYRAPGQGVSRADLPELREAQRLYGADFGFVARVGAGITGGGELRHQQFKNILLNSLIQGEDAEGARDLLGTVFRGFAGRNFIRGLSLFNQYGGGEDSPLRERAFGFATDAFKRYLPGADVRAIAEGYLETPRATFGRAGSLPARRAFQEARAELFAGPDVETGIHNFAAKLGDAMSAEMSRALERSLTRGTGLQALTKETFRVIRLNAGRLARRGLGDEETADVFEERIRQAGERYGKRIKDYVPFFKEAFQIQQRLNDALFAGQVGAANTLGDSALVAQLIQGRLAPQLATYESARGYRRDLAARAAGLEGGFLGAEEGLRSTKTRAAEAYRDIGAGFGPLGTLALYSGDPAKVQAALAAVPGGLDRSIALLKEFTDAQMDALESELNLATQLRDTFRGLERAFRDIAEGAAAARGLYTARDRIGRVRGEALTALGQIDPANLKSEASIRGATEGQAKLAELLGLATNQRAVYRGASEFFGGVQEQLDVGRRGRMAIGDIIGKRRARLEALTPKALAGDTEALADIQRFLPEYLNLVQQNYAPGSAPYAEAVGFVDKIAGQLKVDAATQTQKMDDLIGEIQAQAKRWEDLYGPAGDKEQQRIDQVKASIADFKQTYIYIATLAEGLAQQNLHAEADKLGKLIGNEPSVKATLDAIAKKAYGVGGSAGGGHVGAGEARWVGEQGPELFIPASSGHVVPGGRARRGGDVNVTMGNVQVSVARGTTPEEAADLVFEAVRKGHHARLVKELRRAITGSAG